MHTDFTLYIAVAVIASVLNLVIFYLIIRTAVSTGAETQKRLKHAWAQTELMLAIARKQGVDENSLRSITDRLK
ncbi:MAG: hypothetical protein QM831_37205 [Kofleriaceae bacterium]